MCGCGELGACETKHTQVKSESWLQAGCALNLFQQWVYTDSETWHFNKL